MAKDAPNYWLGSYPILMEALAAQTEGMTPKDVADILDHMDKEIARSKKDASVVTLDDNEILHTYLEEHVFNA